VKIAMVSEHASPLAVLGGEDAGGQNVHVAALAGALADRGHEVEVYTRRDDPTLPPVRRMRPGVDVVHVPAGPACRLPKDVLDVHMPAFGAWLADRWRHGRPPDVVHAHFWMSGLAALTARVRTGVPVVQTFHALGAVKRRHQGDADTSPSGRIAAERRLARESDAVIATCSDEVRELLALGAPLEPLRVVPCGIDTRRFTPDGPALPRPADRSRVVYVGRLVERKGIATAVLAMCHLPDAELVIAGGPDAAELAADPQARRLIDLAAREGLTDRVRLVGRLEHANLPALLRSADALVSVPWYEPFGIAPVEAMACGVPVVTSNVGGMLDTVVDGVTGVHVPPREPAALGAALRRLLADPRQASAMGRAGARRAARRYSWQHVAMATEAVYEQVMRGRQRSAVDVRHAGAMALTASERAAG
jgi:glycosyltransferase involved in cell wall biosynthesis